MHPQIEAQFQELRGRFADLRYWDLADGSTLFEVPRQPLRPAGAWNKQETAILFAAPLGYPQARPDCFWADDDLRLSGGAMPTNTGLQSIPNAPPEIGQRLWFSWHVTSWDLQKDTLSTYVEVIRQRLKEAR